MKHTFVKGLLSCVVMSSIFACNSNNQESTATTVDKEQIKKDIQAKEDEFADRKSVV